MSENQAVSSDRTAATPKGRMEDVNEDAMRLCPECGESIPRNFTLGQCPRCMLGAGVVEIDDATLAMDSEGLPDSKDVKVTSQSEKPKTTGAAEFAPSIESMEECFSELEVLELLGAGGMGAVYKVRQPRLDRLAALKVLSCPPEFYEGFALRFEREAQLLAKLNHPHIVTIYDFGESARPKSMEGVGDLFYFLMEYVDGTDLNKLIRTGGLQPEQALRIVPQICDALQFAHDKGITHRDIKPANILVDLDGNVKIADFGLAKLIEGEEEALMSGLTMTGTSMGTPHYMAPEQWDAPEKVDHRADIYSLGVVFYEMLTGQRPHGVFDPPSRKIEVDVRLDEVVLKAMEADVERRYQQASEVKEDVTRVSEEPMPQRTARKGGAGKWIAVAACVALLGAGAWWWKLDGSEPLSLDVAPESSPKVNEASSGREEGAKGVSTLTKTEPMIPASKPGRLRGVGSIQLPGGDGTLKSLDLAAAEGITDFVQLRAKMFGRWVALRSNGETISNSPEAFEPRSNIQRMGARSGSGNNVVYIDLEGRATPAQMDGELNAGALPEVEEPVVEVHAQSHGLIAQSHGLMLLKSGQAVAWGKVYDDPDFVANNAGHTKLWPRPDPADLQDVRALAIGHKSAAVLKSDGSVVAWDKDGPISLPEEMQSGIVQIAVSGTSDSIVAVDSQNRVWWCLRDGTLREDLCLDGVVAVHPGDREFAPPLYQREDGSWEFFPVYEEKYAEAYPEILAAMPNLKGLPPDAFYLRLSDPNQTQSQEAFLLWIEPAAAEAGGSTAVVSPKLAAMKERGGKLRVWKSPDWGDKPYDISRADGIDDFYSLPTVEHKDWVALRHGGSSVSAGGWFNGVEGLDWAHLEAPAYGGTRDGKLLVSHGDNLAGLRDIRESLPDLVEVGHFIMRSSTGEVRLATPSVEKPRGWETVRSRLESLTGVRAVSNQGFLKGGAILSDGTPLCWIFRNADSFVDPPEEARDLVELHATGSGWVALSRDGRVISWGENGEVEGSPLEPPIDLPLATTLRCDNHLTAAQTQDGTWRAWCADLPPQGWESAEDARVIVDFINQKMGPALDLNFSHPGTGGRVVVWIEPAAIEGAEVAGTQAGEERHFEIAPGASLPFLWCPPGEFWMGSPENEVGRKPDETRHQVTLSEGFWMAKTEFTRADWEKVTGKRAKWGDRFGPDTPVSGVSWNQIAGPSGFIDSIQDFAPSGWRFDLPTEAQWEYACRAGTETLFFWGPNQPGNRPFHLYANFADRNSDEPWSLAQLDDGYEESAPVGSYQPNPWGFRDIVGNVNELCRDWKGDYPDEAVVDPVGPPSGEEKVTRGGSYINGWSDLRSASRFVIEPDFSGNPTTGFRLVLVKESSN